MRRTQTRAKDGRRPVRDMRLLALLAVVAAAALLWPAMADATDVAGAISGDVTWTTAGSPYVLTGDSQVTFGATLTVEPGVAILGGGHSLEVFGHMSAVGTPGEPVVMRDVHVLGRGLYIHPDTVQPCSVVIQNADIDRGSVQGGGHRLFGSFEMRDSIVSNSLDQLFLWFPTEECTIERTVFLNGGKITTHLWGADAHVLHGIFWRADDLAPIRDSAIQNREAYLGYGTYAHGNSFLNSSFIAASLSDWGAAASFEATRNWWSTTETATVESMIYDANDSASVPATIAFEPFLAGPDPEAPHYRLPLSTTATIGASPALIPQGGSANITVTVDDSRTCDVFGTPVVLYASTDGANWLETASGVTGTSGGILFSVSPTVETQYRAEATGVEGVYEPSSTGIVTVSIEGGGVTKVKRISGRDRYAVAVNAARETKDPTGDKSWPGVTHVILASGEDRAAADPLAAAGLSWAYDNAPLLLTKSTSVPSTVVRAIGEIAEANQAGQDTVVVHVVGGDTSIPWTRLLEIADGVRALFGDDAADALLFDRIQATGSRYDLARAIALRMKDVRGSQMPARALIANGADSNKFFDALALSAVSARTGAPVLLVGYSTIPSQTTRTLADLGIAAANRYIAGGPNTVSDSVAKTLGVLSANRWYGRTRYSTAKAVADAAVAKGWLETTCTGVAAKLADALTGGSMTGGMGGGLVITTSSPLQSDCKKWLVNRSSSLSQVWVFGGTISVTPGTYNEVVAAVQ